jgi:hypothetical protein
MDYGHINAIWNYKMPGDHVEFIDKLHQIFIESWFWLVAGIIGVIMWFGRRHLSQFDEVLKNYVHEEIHSQHIEDINVRMLACQENLRSEYRELRHEFQALNVRLDKIMEFLIEHK